MEMSLIAGSNYLAPLPFIYLESLIFFKVCNNGNFFCLPNLIRPYIKLVNVLYRLIHASECYDGDSITGL